MPLGDEGATSSRPKDGTRLIRTFSGETDVEKFLENVSEVALLMGWDEDHTILVIKIKCMGKANDYLETAIPVGEKVRLDELKSLLLKEYKRSEKLTTKLRQFRECRQNPDETVVSFANRVKKFGLKTCETKEEKDQLAPRFLAQFA